MSKQKVHMGVTRVFLSTRSSEVYYKYQTAPDCNEKNELSMKHKLSFLWSEVTCKHCLKKKPDDNTNKQLH